MARRNTETIPWKIWVPAHLALKIELLYCDPVSGRPNYGARSHLIVALLTEFSNNLDLHKRVKPGAIKDLVDRMIVAGEKGASPNDHE